MKLPNFHYTGWNINEFRNATDEVHEEIYITFEIKRLYHNIVLNSMIFIRRVLKTNFNSLFASCYFDLVFLVISFIFA